MPRFVLLRHTLPPESSRSSHWDFMIERDGMLRTWALAQDPLSESMIAATRLPDHRIDYLEFEGEISGGRGRVQRCDGGAYTLIEQTSKLLVLDLFGGRLRGRVTLQCDDASDQRWRFELVRSLPVEGDMSAF